MFNPNYYSLALKKIPKRYLLVNILSRRMRQLQKGSEPLVQIEEGNSISNADIALKEIVEEKLVINEPEVPEVKRKKSPRKSK
ncbi:MAG: DNA-directed RNA polymerase subunit omega [Nitrospinae bacterium RIFCSPLOWO2_12_39_16]|nr:MAG: DNA-directed RNA polymerase subunit omega [Nitrospinae bacterium RIFCSPLOWO2_12_39_16]HLA48421.1 DNA-directed RNA polymerase subunit omega [Nitrospinota bacterium]